MKVRKSYLYNSGFFFGVVAYGCPLLFVCVAAAVVGPEWGGASLGRKWLSGEERDQDKLIALLRSRGAQLMLGEVELSGKLCAAAEEGGGAERGFKDRLTHTAEQEAAFHQHTRGPLLELLKQP